MIILATSIILSLNSDNIVGKSKEARNARIAKRNARLSGQAARDKDEHSKPTTFMCPTCHKSYPSKKKGKGKCKYCGTKL